MARADLRRFPGAAAAARSRPGRCRALGAVGVARMRRLGAR